MYKRLDPFSNPQSLNLKFIKLDSSLVLPTEEGDEHFKPRSIRTSFK